MGFFSRLFGGDPDPMPPEEVEMLRAVASRVARPAVHFMPAAGEAPSYFGGQPRLPPGTPWPLSAVTGSELTFLASIDMRSVAGVLEFDWLPRTGRLLFFYDAEREPWGFDPNDRGSWSVIYVEGNAAPGPPPPGKLPTRFFVPNRIGSLPSYERQEIESLALTELQGDWLIDFGAEVYQEEPKHQMGGYPQPIQGDEMELECQLASNGINVGEPSGYEDPRAAALGPGAADWRLLLQVDSDDELNLMWGDAGTVYFWIREDDARARRFERVWLVLQCH